MKLLVELSTEVDGDVFVWYTFGIGRWCSNDIRLFFFGLHLGSERECLNDICLFCLVYFQGRKEVLE